MYFFIFISFCKDRRGSSWRHEWHLTKFLNCLFVSKNVDIFLDVFNSSQYLSLKTGSVTPQKQRSWQRGHQGATRHIRFEFLVQNLIEGASSGIFRKTVDVCVDVFNAFQCLSCSVAQRIHRWGPTYHWESRSRLNGMTIKVKWEVHSCPFKGLSQHAQGFEFDDEWCHKVKGHV